MRTRILALAIAAMLAWSAGPVTAHEGAGDLAIEESSPVTDNQVRYVVRLISVNDGHGAVNATVTATAVAADGTAQTPVPLMAVDEDGRYAATITFPAPGTWTVRFTAVKPPAVLEQPATIAAPASTTTTTTALPATTATAPPNDEDAGSGGNGPIVGALLAAGVLVIVVAVWAAKRRNG